MTVNGNQGEVPNYEPNTLNGPIEDAKFKQAASTLTGATGRYPYQHTNDNFEQPRALFKTVMTETDRAHLIENIVGDLGNCRKDIQERMVKLFYKIDPEYGERIEKGLNLVKK